MAIMRVDFLSNCLHRTVSISVIMPSDKRTFRGDVIHPGPYKTLYLLHGIFGNDTDWLINTNIQQYADAYNLCVVMPCGDNKFYCNSDISGDYYGTYIAQELVAFTRRTFNLSKHYEDTYIGGLSMGGYGAICNGLRNPETFSHIIALSSGLIKDLVINADENLNHSQLNANHYKTFFNLKNLSDFNNSDNDYDYLALKGIGQPQPRLFVACGKQDHLYQVNKDYYCKLKELNYDVEWFCVDGKHNWAFWDLAIKEALAWLPLDKPSKGISSGNIGKE